MKKVILIGFIQFIFAFSFGQVYILDENFNSAPGVTIVGLIGGPGFYNNVDNYGRDANSLAFNTTGQRITYNWSTLVPDLIQFGFKGQSGAGSTILVEESANGTVWTIVGNPTSITTYSVYSKSLLSTTRYVRLTFTKSTNNVSFDDLKIRQAGNCISSPILKWLNINGSCDFSPSGCEGGHEFAYAKNGNSILNIDDLELSLPTGDGTGGNTIGPNATNATTRWVTNAGMSAAMIAYISSINAASGCSGNFLPITATGTVPANANMLLFIGSTPVFIFNFSTICPEGTIYVLFAEFGCPGKFGNSSCSSNCNRGISISNTATGCINTYSYTSGGFGSSGAGVLFNTNNNSPTSYGSGCNNFTPLPITLADFYAKPNESSVNLNWRVETEINVDHYIIERSTDGLNFAPISTVKSIAETNGYYNLNYSTLDYAPKNGVNYYRLVNVDKDGSTQYNKTIMVNFNQTHTSDVWVNQTEKDIIVSFEASFSNKTFYLMDMNGKKVGEYKNLNTELNYFTIDKLNLPKGLYVVGCLDAIMPPEKLLIN